MKRLLTLGAVVALTAAWAWSLDTSKLKPTGYVNDFAHKLDPAGEQTLESYCAELERATGAQMAIVLVDSLDGEPVEDVANRLYREWGIGKKGKDEGILILLSMQEHKSRIEVGYGLEPVITDGFSGGLLRDIRPILRQGNYSGALLAAAEQLGNQIAQAKGVSLAQPQAVPQNFGYPAGRARGIPWPLILIGIFILFSLLGRGTGGGSGTGFLTGMLLGNMMGGRRGGWGGGGFGGYDGGGGGGGGFGGFGGGDSGGGGASGGW